MNTPYVYSKGQRPQRLLVLRSTKVYKVLLFSWHGYTQITLATRGRKAGCLHRIRRPILSQGGL